jgi:DNA polymerase-3 subunit beta
VPADVESEGTAVVPGKSLFELVRRLPPGPLALEAPDDGHDLALRFGEADYRLATLSAADFPDVAPPAGGEQLTVDRAAFAETVASVARAASRDQSRPVYTGISMTVAAGSLTLVATDGHRLAVKTTPVRADAEISHLLIPARALEELVRLPTSDDLLVIGVTANRVTFEVGGFLLTSRRLDGHFQPYESLVNGAFAHVATVSRGPLLEAVERAMVMVARNSPVELSFESDDVVVQVTTAELGRARERLALTEAGPSLTVAVNAAYLRDGLALVRGERVRLQMNDGLRPIVMRGASDDFTYLVAPVRRPGVAA